MGGQTLPGAGAARGRAKLGGVARGGMLGLVGAGVSAAAGILVVLVLTRTLPAADAGTFFAVTSVFLLCQTVSKLGTPTSLVYFISRFRSLGVPERIVGCLRAAFGPVLGASLLIAAAMYAAAPWLTDLLLGAPSEQAQTALRVLAVLVPVAAVADAAVSATRGFDTMVPTVALDRMGRSLLQVLAVALAVLLGWQAVGILVAAWALPYLLPAVLGSRDLARRVRTALAAPPGQDRHGDDRPGTAQPLTAGEFWRFTGPRALASIAQIALQRLDIVLVAALLGPVPAAIYTAATRVLVAGQLSNQAISSALQPRLGELLARDDVSATNAAYRAATGWLVLLNWPLYLLFALFAPLFLSVFGRDYGAGYSVVVILSVAMLLASACGMVNLVLVMAGRTTWNLANALLALGVNVGVDLLLIPRMGIAGAAVGWAAAIAVSNLVALAQIYALKGLHPFGAGTLVAMALSLTCFGAIPGSTLLLLGNGLNALLLSTLIGTAAYGVGCYHLRKPLALDVFRARTSGRAR